jgi:hypothetical protein
MLSLTSRDMSNLQYQRYIHGIYRASTPWAPMLVAAGYEHSLQVHRDAVGLSVLPIEEGERTQPVFRRCLATGPPNCGRRPR